MSWIRERKERPTDHRLAQVYTIGFNDMIETTGMKQQLHHIKDNIVRAVNEQMTKRMIASTMRHRDGMERAEERKLVRIKQPFTGDTNSMLKFLVV